MGDNVSVHIGIKAPPEWYDIIDIRVHNGLPINYQTLASDA